MKKAIGIITLLWAISLSAFAITDQEIMTQVMMLYQEGMDEVTIAKQMIAQGATIEQLQRIKEQASMMRTAQTPSLSQGVIYEERTDNGEPRNMPIFMSMPKIRLRDVYGQNIFRSQEEGFKPNMNQSTPQNYKLGAGDEVIIDIYGASQLQIKRQITPDGTITIENYGPVNLSGLSIQEATRRLKNTIGTRYQNCQILLSLGQTRSISVNVMGEVEIPGTYQLSAFSDVFHALSMAGGITENGTIRDIKIYRGGSQVGSVDIYAYLMDGSLSGNVRLEDQDIIIVSTYQELVHIDGQVKRPMFYEMKKGETLDKLLYYAGGFSGDAYTEAVTIARKNDGAQSINTVKNEYFDKFAVMDGDSVSVHAILPRLKNTVEIQGAIFRPGHYGISDNLKTIRDLVAAADGPTEVAFTERAVLYRMKLDRTYQAVPINLSGILDGSAADVELLNEDQLFIPSEQEKLERQYVVIHGEVFQPDTFKYAENESVEDLILRAGGLTDRASTSKVDISRRIFDSKSTQDSEIKMKTFTVEISDNLGLNEQGFILEPFDEVYVRRSPSYSDPMNVNIRGEVVFAGTYAMKTKTDRLSELVIAAGGLTRYAYAKGARLQRTMTEDERRRRDLLLKLNKTTNENNEIDIDKLDISNTYWVGIDLEAALENPGSDEDIILRDGDILVVPSINNTVKINGEVRYPNTVSYIAGKRARYYIDMAGGYSNRARRARAYIIYSNGKVAPASQGKVMPGCEIVVPSRADRRSTNPTQWVGIASATASMASVAATITTVVINTINRQK